MTKLFTYIIILISINSYACDCLYSGGFLKTVYDSEYVLKIRVQKKLKMFSEYDNEYFENGILVKVESVIKGFLQSDTASIFIISPFISCGSNLEDFIIGSEWVVAINRNAKNNRLYFSSCKIDLLRLDNNIVFGLNTSNTKCEGRAESYQYDSLVKMINNPSEYLLPTKDCNNKEFYLWVNEMPKPLIEKDSLDQILYRELNLKNDSFEKCLWATFNIYIDANGEVVKVDGDFECFSAISNEADYVSKTIEILSQKTKWIPGNHFGKNLNINLTYKKDFDEIKKKYETQ